jgi:hypothetical protein
MNTFWAIVANAMVIGGAVAGGALGFYWFVVLPASLPPRSSASEVARRQNP